MKILFPLEVFFPSQAGGTANTVYWITKNLRPHGINAIIVATDKGIDSDVPLNRWNDSEVGRVIFVKTNHLNLPVWQTLIAFRAFVQADVVHVSSIFFPTAFLTAIVSRLFSKKLVWSPHGELDPAALAYSAPRKRPVLWLIRKLIGTFPLFHSTCDEETQYIRQVFGPDARVEYVPNFLEIPAAVTRSPETYLLFIGRIHPKKAIDNLLRALLLSRQFMKSGRKLKIAGKGKPKVERELRDLVDELGLTDRVEILGQVEGSEKEHLLANAHWTIMPSHTENFGLVVVESMAQSTPVVASTGTPWKSLEDERVGVWTGNSPESLAAALDRILSMPPSDYEEMRSRCRGFIEDRFDIEKNIHRWLDLYQNLK